MKKEIHLRDIENHLGDSLVILDHDFLKQMITVAANGDSEPYKNKPFVKKLGWNYNKKYKKACGLYFLFSKNRAIKFSTLKMIKNLSDYSWNDIETKIISIRKGRSRGEVKIDWPIKINKKLGLIVGHILGDGSISRRYSQVFFTNSNKDLILEFYHSMKSIFGIEARIWLQEPGKFKKKSKWIKRLHSINEIEEEYQIGLFYPTITGILLNVIFGNFANGRNKKITKEIMLAPKQFKIGLIRSFFDSEGTMDKTHGPRFFQDDKEILEALKNILAEFNIGSSKIKYYIKTAKKRHYLDVTNLRNYSRYSQIIGCTSKNKQNNLNRLIKVVSTDSMSIRKDILNQKR